MRIHLISALFLASAACVKSSTTQPSAGEVIITDTNTNPGAETSTTSTTSASSKTSSDPLITSVATSKTSSHTSSSTVLNAAESAIQATDAYVVSILKDREALYSFLQNTAQALSFYQGAYELKYGTAWSAAIVSDLNKVTASDGASSILVAYESLVPQITANPESDTARYASLLSEFESAQTAWLQFFTPSASSASTDGQAVVSWVTATASPVTTLSMLEVATTASKAGSASKFVPLFGILGGVAVVLL